MFVTLALRIVEKSSAKVSPEMPPKMIMSVLDICALALGSPEMKSLFCTTSISHLADLTGASKLTKSITSMQLLAAG